MKFTRVVSFLAVLLALFVAAGSSANAKAAKKYVEGELLVKYQNGLASPDSLFANSISGATVVQDFPDLSWQLVKLPAGVTVEQGLAQYANLVGVENAQPNYIYKLAANPNDAQFSQLYGMTKIKAPAAWETTTGSPNVVVAIIDTGIRYTHEDLAANMWRNTGEIAANGVDDDANGFVDDVYGWDFFYNDSDPIDENGHGTHVAGTVGAVGNNTIGVAGVNWNVRLMAIKIYNNTGFGSTSAMLVNAYNYVRMMKTRGVNIRVTSNSYGGCDEACGYDQATKDAIDRLGESDVLNVFAAGNDNRNIETMPFYPASYNSPQILSVAASDQNDNRGSFSNFGVTSVDVAAPGVGILSTFHSNNSAYTSLTGTSMAAPHVSGAAALLAAANPSLSAASLKASLMNSVDVLSQWNGVVKTGGRLNVARAIQMPTACSYSFPTQFAPIPATGGSITINVVAPPNCDFSVASLDSWLLVDSGNPGSGNATVVISAGSNNGQPRGGSIKIAGQNIGIVQTGYNPPPTAPTPAVLDFDGDRRTDYSVLQNSGGSLIWHNFNSVAGYKVVNFGLASDVAVPADYDGDGITDIAVWRGSAQSYFYVLNSSNNAFQTVQWGTNGDAPNVAQDFDGDSKADFAVTRRAGGQLFWYIRQSSNGGLRAAQYGSETDIPVRGDFDGDLKADLAVYRPASGNPANSFIVLNSRQNNLTVYNFGKSETDKIVPGDYDGDGKTDFAVFRTTNGTWYLQQSRDGFRAAQFGTSVDLPVPGDYDGDGKTDVAVWRPNAAANESAMFYILPSRGASSLTAFGWGQNQMRVPANSLQVGN
ncbi:MAG: S8 family serine peptidase [Acidobacteriota bacterium]|nr:S8 family serine peptidase [Acidobacteriota bacterium]